MSVRVTRMASVCVRAALIGLPFSLVLDTLLLPVLVVIAPDAPEGQANPCLHP